MSQTADKVYIKNLMVPCNVGVTEEGTAKAQNVIVDVEICCDLKAKPAATAT